MTSVSKTIVPFRRAEIRRREQEIAFLPAALEITERPPSPAGRATGASIIAVFCVALAWASLGKVDIVTTSTGKIVPGGRIKKPRSPLGVRGPWSLRSLEAPVRRV